MPYLETSLHLSGLLQGHLSTKDTYPLPFPGSLSQFTSSVFSPLLLYWISVILELPALSIATKATPVCQATPFNQLGPCHMERNTYAL